MRGISNNFIENLTSGFLSPLRKRVVQDKDLDLQIRENYINIYYKGNSLLKLSEVRGIDYKPEIHKKFTGDLVIEDFIDEETAQAFLDYLPNIKENIIRHGASSLEVEYEQLLVRANNNETRSNSEYFIVDRQLALPGRDRIDLSAIFWERKGRRRGQEVPLCFIEMKFALNTDIQEVHDQIARYYDSVNLRTEYMAQEAERVFHQKLELGLFNQPHDRIEAMKTLRVTRDLNKFQFILVMVDYNPYSKLLDLSRLNQLPFAKQVRIFHAGFAMWQSNLESLSLSNSVNEH